MAKTFEFSSMQHHMCMTDMQTLHLSVIALKKKNFCGVFHKPLLEGMDWYRNKVKFGFSEREEHGIGFFPIYIY